MHDMLHLLVPMRHLLRPVYTQVIGRVMHMYKYDMHV